MKKSGADYGGFSTITFGRRGSSSTGFPNIYQTCSADTALDMNQGTDSGGARSAHYHLAASVIDERGRTETRDRGAVMPLVKWPCTAWHGANRLASNSLLERWSWPIAAAVKVAPPPAGSPAASFSPDRLGAR